MLKASEDVKEAPPPVIDTMAVDICPINLLLLER